MFKYLVLVAGILLITAIINSYIGKNRSKWFPGQFETLKAIDKDAFKTFKDFLKSLDLVIKAEGILVVIIWTIAVILYSVLVFYLL